jgi:hypothetical protein
MRPPGLLLARGLHPAAAVAPGVEPAAMGVEMSQIIEKMKIEPTTEQRIAALEAKIAEPHERLENLESLVDEICLQMKNSIAKQREVNAAMLKWIAYVNLGAHFDALEALREALK